MSFKTRFTVEDTTFGVPVVFHIGHTKAEFEQWVSKKYSVDFEVNGEPMGSLYTSIHEPTKVEYYHVWVNGWYNNNTDHGVLVHELFHAVASICEKLGITFSNDSEEVYAYMLDFFYTKALEVIWGRMRKQAEKEESKEREERRKKREEAKKKREKKEKKAKKQEKEELPEVRAARINPPTRFVSPAKPDEEDDMVIAPDWQG